MPGPGADEAEDVALDAMRPQPFVEVAEEQQRRRTVGRDDPAERGDLAAALVAAEAEVGGDQTQAEGRQAGIGCHHLARLTSAAGDVMHLLFLQGKAAGENLSIEIGRASCRERGGQYGENSVGA